MRFNISKALPLFAVIFLPAAPLVHAHSYLIDSTPAAGAILPSSPDSFQLIFSEEIEPEFSSFNLLNQRGEATQELSPRLSIAENGEQLVDFQLDAPLENGVYTLSFAVLSAVDGHITKSSVPFAIGIANAIFEDELEREESLNILRLLVRWIDFIALFILIGALFFPLLRSTSFADSQDRIWQRLLLVSWIALGLSSILDILFQASLLDTSIVAVTTGTE